MKHTVPVCSDRSFIKVSLLVTACIKNQENQYSAVYT